MGRIPRCLGLGLLQVLLLRQVEGLEGLSQLCPDLSRFEVVRRAAVSGKGLNRRSSSQRVGRSGSGVGHPRQLFHQLEARFVAHAVEDDADPVFHWLAHCTAGRPCRLLVTVARHVRGGFAIRSPLQRLAAAQLLRTVCEVSRDVGQPVDILFGIVLADLALRLGQQLGQER
uniref:Putative secreted protein n=1 Tax=Ixodes ricinus TaxID=34613 RepID=A0A6B0UZ79_IXORI